MSLKQHVYKLNKCRLKAWTCVSVCLKVKELSESTQSCFDSSVAWNEVFLFWEIDSEKTWLIFRHFSHYSSYKSVLKWKCQHNKEQLPTMQGKYCAAGVGGTRLHSVFRLTWPERGFIDVVHTSCVCASPRGQRQLAKLEGKIWWGQRSGGELLLFSMLVVKQTAQQKCYF